MDEAPHNPQPPGTSAGTAPVALLPPQKKLGNFELRREIGRGGMGTVYDAWETTLQRRVALKVLGSQVSAVPTSVQRFHREAQAAAKLHHMHIVPIYAQGEEGGVYYYAMELVDGPSLHAIIGNTRERQSAATTVSIADETVALARPELIRDAGGTPAEPAPPAPVELAGASTVALTAAADLVASPEHFRMVARHVASIADALDYAHEQGVIHRDVKPHNLLLGSDGRLRISDFGLARIAEQPGVTMTGDVIGSPLYMSPEQILDGPSRVDHRTDIYSLGATLYEWLTLRPPYPGETREQVIRLIAGTEPLPLRALNPRIPVDLETICMKAIERDRTRRYQTAGELRDDLRRFLENRPIKARRAALTTRLGKLVARHQLASLGAVAVVVALALGLALRAKQSEVRSQLAAVEEAKQDKDHILDLLSSLPVEIGGSLRVAEAAVEGLVETGQRMTSLAADDSQGANVTAVGTVGGIAARTVYDLYDAVGPDDWPDTGGAGPCSAAAMKPLSLRGGDLEEERRLVERCLLVEPDHYHARQLHAALACALKQYDTMLEDAHDLVQLRPEESRGHLWLSLAHLLQHDGQALSALQSLPMTEAAAPWAGTLEALALLDLHRPEDAVTKLTEVIIRAPNLTVAHLGRAAAHAAAGALQSAVGDLTTVIEAEPGNADALALRGDHHMMLGEYAAAINDFDQAMKIAGRTPAMVGRYFSALLAQRNETKADTEPENGPGEAEGGGPPSTENSADQPIQGWFSRYVWPRMPDQRKKDSTSPPL